MSSEAPPSPNIPYETKLGVELFHNISTTVTNENIIISPLMLEATLALLYLGSDDSTAAELQDKLEIKQRFATNAKMANYYATHLTNATNGADTKILLQNKLLLHEIHAVADDFRKIAQTYFHMTDEQLNLRVNNLAKLQAHIQQILIKIDIDSVVNFQLPTAEEAASALLLLAANFQSKWFLPFSAYRSGLYEFHVNATEIQTVPMLFDDDMFVKFGEFRELNARAIELPYEHDDEFAMLLILPNQRDGLTQLECNLRNVNLSALQQRMQMESVQVLLPRFTIDFECNLRQALKQLGYSEIFSANANFKHLINAPTTQNYTLHIADVLHKVHIAVNETGSLASSPITVTSKPIVISNSINGRQKFFRADHPFYFAIRAGDVTHFLGHVVKF